MALPELEVMVGQMIVADLRGLTPVPEHKASKPPSPRLDNFSQTGYFGFA